MRVRKVIAKLHKTRSKKFSAKQLYIVSIPKQIPVQQNKFNLYCYLVIEGAYFDIDNEDDCHPFEFPTPDEQISMTVKNKNGITIYHNKSVSSGMKEFEFLIQHYQNLGTPQYLQLSELLTVYQEQCKQQTLHFRDLKDKYKSRILDEEEIVSALKNFESYFKSYVAENYDETDFIAYYEFLPDLEQEDLNLNSFTVSQALMSLFGYDLESPQLEMRGNVLNLSDMLGLNRIQNMIIQLMLYTGHLQKAQTMIEIVTVDDIKLTICIEMTTVVWPDHPDWLETGDAVGLIFQIFVGLNQLEAILKIRQERASYQKKMLPSVGRTRKGYQFEQQMYQEIFIEKYYPEKAQEMQSTDKLLGNKESQIVK